MAEAPKADGPGNGALRVAAFRFRSTLSRRWGGYLALILIVSLLGGLALASVAGARRTQSAFPRFLAASNPSDIAIDEGSYNPAIINAIRHLPGVTSVRSYVAFNVGVLNAHGAPDVNSAFNQAVEFVGSIDGLYFDQDRIAVLSGRRANEHRPDEAMVSAQTAEQFNLHVGSTLPIGFYSNQQFATPGFNLATPPYHSLTLHIVGIGEFADEVVQDDVDKIPRVLITPALTRQFLGCCTTYAWNGVQLRSGTAGVPALERTYSAHLPKGYPVYVRVNSVVEAQGERAVKPQSVALGVFGIIVALAALVLAGQAVSRLISQLQEEHLIMRSIGATPRQLMSDSLVGLLLALVLGALGAAVAAVALSPISPIGAVRQIEVSPGISFDWTVLLWGIALFCLVPGVVALALSYRATLEGQAQRRTAARKRGNGAVRTAAAAGLPVAAVTGIDLALDPGRSRNAVPVRSAIVGTTLAVLTLTSAITFGASLNTLVDHPNLYGWNWTGALIAGAGYGDVPGQEAARLLNADRGVEAWNGIYVGALEIDNHLVPTAGAIKVRARVDPPILSGHRLEARNQVVLGAATLAELHKQVGDTVTVSNSISTRPMRIVGTATMPTVGVGHGLHLSMGSGAWVYFDELPSPARNIQQNALLGANILLIRYAARVTPMDSSRDLASLAQRLSNYNPTHMNPANLPGISAVTLERPAEIVNYRSMGAAPVILGVGLTIGSAFALAVTLAASVRRRRRELALLKTLGFTQRQLRAAVAWQSSVVVVIGMAIGIPLGIGLGRGLWRAFANELHVVSDPTVPVVWIGLIAVGSLLLANLVAALPARFAGRTPTALVLREE